MELRAVPVGHGLQRRGGLFSSVPFQAASHSVLPEKLLGETEESLYPRARAGVPKFDQLRGAFAEIPDEAYRAKVVDEMRGSPVELSGPSLGVETSSAVCAAAGLVILGTIVYFAFAVR